MVKYDEVKKIAKKCLKCKNPSCVKGCPLNNPIPEILTLIENDKITEASDLLFSNTLVSGICSKLCDVARTCFGNCILSKKNNGVEFFKVEEYLSDKFNEDYFLPQQKNNSQNAIIFGGGISGIILAIYLSLSNIKVKLIEKENKLGGVITQTLPNFRYDDSIINKYVNILNKLDVDIIYNKEFGRDYKIEDTLKYDICIFAMGTQIVKNSMYNEDYFLNSLDILKKVKRNEDIISNKTILVIGGGNVAMDVARTLNKYDNNVQIVYRRDIENAPASKKEINDAIKEGVVFNECLAPIGFNVINDKLESLQVEKMILVDDPSSNRKMFKGTKEYASINCDYVVWAVGLDADYGYLKEKLPELFNEDGWIKEDGIIKNNVQYYATGDYLTGASNFAKAVNISKQIYKKVVEKL